MTANPPAPPLARPLTAAGFNQFIAEKKLMAGRCMACATLALPPRAVCNNCHSGQMEWVETSGLGTLAAFTIIYIAPTFMVDQGYGRDKPYLSGIVELEEGVRISARILGFDASQPESIQIGTPLVVDFIEQGEGEAHQTYLAFRRA